MAGLDIAPGGLRRVPPDCLGNRLDLRVVVVLSRGKEVDTVAP